MRNLFSLILLLGAAICAFAGSTLQWVYHNAHNVGPIKDLAGAIAQDEAVSQALSGVVISSVDAQLPGSVDTIPGARGLVTSALDGGVDAALSDDGIGSAWYSSVREARDQLVHDLTEFHDSSRLEPPSIWFDVEPFVSLTRDALASTDPRIAAVLAEVEIPANLHVEVATLPLSVAGAASDTLALAEWFLAAYTLALALFIGGLLLGTGAGRWISLALAGLVGVGLAAALGLVSGSFPVPSLGGELIDAIARTLVDHLGASLNQWLTPYWYGCWAAVVVGIVGALVKRFNRQAGVV